MGPWNNSVFTGVIYYFLILYDCATLVPTSRIVSITKQYIITQENAIFLLKIAKNFAYLFGTSDKPSK